MSYCDCDYDDCDRPAFCEQFMVKSARKQHRCVECDGPILVGESYWKTVGKWDDLQTFRECVLCLDLRQWAEISMPCFCSYIFGELHERVRDMVTDVAPKVPGFFMEYGRRMIAIRQRRAAHTQAGAK